MKFHNVSLLFIAFAYLACAENESISAGKTTALIPEMKKSEIETANQAEQNKETISKPYIIQPDQVRTGQISVSMSPATENFSTDVTSMSIMIGHRYGVPRSFPLMTFSVTADTLNFVEFCSTSNDDLTFAESATIYIGAFDLGELNESINGSHECNSMWTPSCNTESAVNIFNAIGGGSVSTYKSLGKAPVVINDGILTADITDMYKSAQTLSTNKITLLFVNETDESFGGLLYDGNHYYCGYHCDGNYTFSISTPLLIAR